MISSIDTRHFVPYGRGYMRTHPGNYSNKTQPLVNALRDFSITSSTAPKDSWMLRENCADAREDDCDEELYIAGNTVVWSKGSNDGGGRVIKSFTMDSPIQQALWCRMLLASENTDAAPIVQDSIAIIDEKTVNIFTMGGKDYKTTLPFPIAKTWRMKDGLLFTFDSKAQKKTTPVANVTPMANVCEGLPVLFSMHHPLDEVAPVICKTGANKVSYVTDANIIFTSDEPSIVVMYDAALGVHTVWSIACAKPEEIDLSQQHHQQNGQNYQDPASMDTGTPSFTPSLGYSRSISLRYNVSSLSPSLYHSPYGASSSLAGGSKHSPAMAGAGAAGGDKPRGFASPLLSLALLSRSPNSPFLSPRRSFPASPRCVPGPRTPSGVCDNAFCQETHAEPILPEICMESLWTEPASQANKYAGESGQASKVFLTRDVCGQRYLCFVVPLKQHVRCLKFAESNDQSQLIFGSVTQISGSIDATPLSSLDMMLVLDLSHNLLLYTGVVKMTQVHVQGLPAHLQVSMAESSGLELPCTSSRPPSAAGRRDRHTMDEDEEAPMLSPVPTEVTDSPSYIETSLSDDPPSFTVPSHPQGQVAALRDAVNNRITVVLHDGSLYRTCLPVMSSSPIISLCMSAACHILPRDAALSLVTRWYSSLHAPGAANGSSHWHQFVRCLLSLMGYDAARVVGTAGTSVGVGALNYHGNSRDDTLSPVMARKKARPEAIGVTEDWDYMLASEHHVYASGKEGEKRGMRKEMPPKTPSTPSRPTLDSKALLLPYLPTVMFALHLVYEELKLELLHVDDLENLAALLHHLARDLGWHDYVDHYCRDHPPLFGCTDQLTNITPKQRKLWKAESYLVPDPPSIYHWLTILMSNPKSMDPFPCLPPSVSTTTRNVIAMYAVLTHKDPSVRSIQWSQYMKKVPCGAGQRSPDLDSSLLQAIQDIPVTADHWQRVVLFMANLGVTKDLLSVGVSLPLKEAISHCRNKPPGDWPKAAYHLIGREDLTQQHMTCMPPSCHNPELPPSIPQEDLTTTAPHSAGNGVGNKGAEADHNSMDNINKELLRLRFSEDLRVKEAQRMLQSSKPVRIALTQRQEVSDHDFIEEQERHLYSLCIRTMALPVGRGILGLCTYHPIPTEVLPVPPLCLTGRAPPRNTAVDLTHIDTPPNMSHWPSFHNGVAAGLRITNSSQLNSTWIVYNKPSTHDLTNEHAGFLMGLGLNRHLNSLDEIMIHDYLSRAHEMSSIGVLLGISAGRRGSMNSGVTRLLGIHLSALLPPTSTELNITHNIQVASILGVGLLYQGTAHRHIAEVLLSEIGRPPGPEMDNCIDRESYSLSAGLALGMVMLGKGHQVGFCDHRMSMADELYHYIVGGHKRPLTGANKERYKSPSYQIKEGDSVNVDVTSPGATLALGMMFFGTNNTAVAKWLEAPDTQYLLDFVRPDFLMLRVISRGLVQWNKVKPTTEWILENVPEIVNKYAFNKHKYTDDSDCSVDFETMSQAHLNIVGGACMVLGLRYAGSANEEAFACLYQEAKRVLKLMGIAYMVEQAGKSTAENCLLVIVLSLAMVMSGTGRLEVLQLCKHLRSRVGPSNSYVLYGSHMAVSMALGMLFMGGGRYSLSTSPEAVAALLCACFPKFPIHSNDNRYHLQAFRHLYVLAAEPRAIVPTDVDTNMPCYVPLMLKHKAGGKEELVQAPWILPELSKLESVRIHGERYWPITFHRDNNWKALQSLLHGTGCLYVKQRAGHLSYKDDPKGYHSVLSKSLTVDQPLGKVIKAEDIQSFSSDPQMLAFAELFCSIKGKKEYEMCQLLSKLLYECVSQEKPHILAALIAMYQAVLGVAANPRPLLLWQVKLMRSLYTHPHTMGTPLMGREVLAALTNMVDDVLIPWTKRSPKELIAYFSGGTVTQYPILAAFLVWFNIPTPSGLNQVGLTGPPTFPDMYRKLSPCGMSVSSIRTLTALLQRIIPAKA